MTAAGATLTLRRPRKKRPPVDLAETLHRQLLLAGITGFQREYQFHPTRRWRLDLAATDIRLGVECEGVGARGKPGRHQLTQHLHANTEKHSALAAMGWRLVRVTGRQIQTGHALAWVQAALAERPEVAALAFAAPGKWGAARKRRRAARSA